MPSQILLIGVGAKGRQTLTKETLKLLETSQILIGGKKLLSQFKDLPAKAMILPSDLSKVLKVLKETPDETVAILALGNENLYGLSRFLHQQFNKGSLKIIPNMEQMNLAFSAAKLSMDGARILTASEINLENVHEWFQTNQTIGIFSDPMITPSVIAKSLFKQRAKDLTAYVCQDVGTKRAKIVRSDIEGLLGRRFPPLSILLLTQASSTIAPTPTPREHQTQSVYGFGIPDANLVHTDRISLPQEVRLVCLAKLSLIPSNILWDIGAGCGAASIEGSRMLSSGDVYAIERDYVQIRHLYENIKRFAAQNITVIEGEPLEALKSIPDPDRVLLQGGSTRMKEIVEVAWLRLKSQGILVICTRNDQDLAQIRDFLKNQDLSHEFIAIHVSKIVFHHGEYPETTLTPLYMVVTEKK